MDEKDILRIAQESMKQHSTLLKNLGRENSVKLHKNPDEDIIQLLKDIAPKSTEGKLLAIGAAALVAYILFKR